MVACEKDGVEKSSVRCEPGWFNSVRWGPELAHKSQQPRLFKHTCQPLALSPLPTRQEVSTQARPPG